MDDEDADNTTETYYGNPHLAVSTGLYRGTNSEQQPPDVGMQIKTSDFSHQLILAQFQGEVPFYDVRYPYWQTPYNIPVWNVPQVIGAGAYHHQSNLGIVGRPLGINDWNTPLQTPYGVLPDELQ